MLLKKICFFAVSLLLALNITISVAAASPYKSYNYTNDGKETSSPDIYTVERVIYGTLLECGTFDEARDIYVDVEDNVYILDSGNSRVLVLNSEFELVDIISEFTLNGEKHTLAQGAEGIFFDGTSKELYIADTNNNRIIVCDKNGVIRTIFEKPKSVLLDENTEYKPTKIIVDNNKNMYILSKNINTGAIMTDKNNDFVGFFGTNKVKETTLIKVERLWKKILSGGKSDYSFQPVAINNLFWGKDRFVYSVSTRNEYLISEVSKLNATGENVLKKTAFADVSSNEQVEVYDIAVNNDGFFSILDRYNGKIYCYDTDANLIGAFGGIGEQEGLYKIPNAISYTSSNKLIVLDSEKDTLTVMKPTEYAEIVFDALTLFQDGKYLESTELLEQANRVNPNFGLIYTGLGKSSYMTGNYAEAMNDFKLGNNKEEYSDAKKEYRNEFLYDNFVLVAIAVVLIFLIIVFYDKVFNFIKKVIGRLFRRNYR